LKDLNEVLNEGLTRRLKIAPDVSTNYRYGQIRRAARFVIQICGHEWAIDIPRSGRAVQNVELRIKIKRITKLVAIAQGKPPSPLWRQLKAHAIQMSAGPYSKALLQRISENTMQKPSAQ
jgi:hypothetical protein